MNIYNNTKTNISSYPENLYSLVRHPQTGFLHLQIASFLFLLIFLLTSWYGIYNSVIEKQNKISGIYTMAFFQNENDSRPPETQALLAIKSLKTDPAIKIISIIENPKTAYNTQATLPSLLHVQIKNGKESLFNASLHGLFKAFPSFAVRNHDKNPRVIDLKNRYDNFLLILNICSFIGILLLLSSLVISLKKWLHPHNDTIKLLHIIGAEESTILQVFSKYIHKDLIKGIIIGTISIFIILLLPLKIINGTNIIKPDTSGVIGQISSLSIVVLAFLCTITIYVIIRLRMHHVLRQFLRDNFTIIK